MKMKREKQIKPDSSNYIDMLLEQSPAEQKDDENIDGSDEDESDLDMEDG